MVWPLLALGVVEMVQKTAEKTVLKSQGKPRLVTRLKLVLLPEPHGHWEGRLKGRRGIARNHAVFIKADIRFPAGVIEGRGVAPEFPTSEPGSLFDLDGALSGQAADFALYFLASTVRRSPFTCTGKLDGKQKNLRGSWSFTCFNPDTCGCEGGGGDFHFWRVD